MFKYHKESLWHCSGKLKKVPRNAVEMYGLFVDHLAPANPQVISLRSSKPKSSKCLPPFVTIGAKAPIFAS